MPSPPNLTNIAPPRVPLTDERTGLISREWYRFFLYLFNITGGGSNITSLTDLQVGPPIAQIDEINTVIDNKTAAITPTQESALDQIAELAKQVEALAVLPLTSWVLSELAELQAQIDGLSTTPALTPVVAAALTEVDDTNVTLTLGGSPNTALLAATSLTLGWTGQLSTTRGGTGLSSYAVGDIVYYAAGTALSKLPIGAVDRVLTSTGSAPQWSNSLSLVQLLITDDIRFQGSAANLALIQKNNSVNRDEFQIYASGDAFSTGSRGSGIHLYGNYDNEHAGNIAFLTGQNDQGTARMIISGGSADPSSGGYRTNTDARVTIGNDIWDFVDTQQDTALLNIKNPIGRPAICFFETSSSEGELTVPTGERLDMGHWDGTTFTNRLSINSSGKLLSPDGAAFYGTVSNSGDSAIIERGNNANGEYTKFADGTMICFVRNSTTPVASTLTSSTHSWPATFSAAPRLSCSPDSGVLGTTLTAFNARASTTTQYTQTILRSNTTVTSLDVIAIGRWY